LERLYNSQIYDFGDLKNVQLFKAAIKTKAGQGLCTNALKIALIHQEEKVASVLLVEYKVRLEEDMLKRAIVTQKFYFIYCMWAFRKNYTESEEGLHHTFSF
jgi:hypothetical protein